VHEQVGLDLSSTIAGTWPTSSLGIVPRCSASSFSLPFEFDGRRIAGINAQHVIDLRPGLFVVAALLRRAGQLQPHRRQTGDRLVALGFHPRADLLHQLPRIIVELGGRGKRATLLRRAGVRQFLAQGDAVGLAINGLLTAAASGGLGADAGAAASKTSTRVRGWLLSSWFRVVGRDSTRFKVRHWHLDLMVHFFWFDLADNTTSFSVMATIL
jgi:hypothetical protein